MINRVLPKLCVPMLLFLWVVGCNSHLHQAARPGNQILTPVTAKDAFVPKASDVGLSSDSDPIESNSLYQAERNDDVQEAAILLKQGSDPNEYIYENKMIDLAAADGHLQFVKLLIHYMPKLTRQQARSYVGQANSVRLNTAVTQGTLREVKSLLSVGADVNNHEENSDIHSDVGVPLMRAVARGSLPLMRCLLAHGANVDQKDERGRTALMYVSGINMYWTAEARDENLPATRLAAGPARLLLRHGANIGIRDSTGKTALMWAAQLNPSAVSLLLAHKARVDARDKWGRTALLCAASVRDAKSMALLLAAGADVNVQDRDGETPLMRASVQPEQPGDDDEAKAQWQEAIAQRRQAIALLLKRGANLHLKDKQRRSVNDYAKMQDGDFIAAS